jgi:hypothetical protein
MEVMLFYIWSIQVVEFHSILQRVCPMVLASSYKWVTLCGVKDHGHATMQSEFVHAPNIQSGSLT